MGQDSKTQQHKLKSKLQNKLSKSEAGVDDVVCQEAFYKDGFGGHVVLIMLLSVIILFLVFINFKILDISPKKKYFFTTDDNRIISSHPLKEPMYSDAEIMDWSAQALLKVFDFNFLNVSTQIEGVRGLFTDAGFAQVVDILKTSFISKIFSKRYIVKASLCDVAEVFESKITTSTIGERYSWQIMLPLHIKFARSKGKSSENEVAKVMVTVERVSDLEYLGGIAISNIEIKELVNIDGIRSFSSLPVCQNG